MVRKFVVALGILAMLTLGVGMSWSYTVSSPGSRYSEHNIFARGFLSGWR